eukprot:TRINITY_DN17540_c0_g1_i2.p1 TRINITY_DN17540_c0_g1~~TRINITY_DN17540_c0_g1_i2.p1  ORF type:complete len:449 (+),score=21.04 TRINITY_DN17540_c0_g1_i2:33-1379(+)
MMVVRRIMLECALLVLFLCVSAPGPVSAASCGDEGGIADAMFSLFIDASHYIASLAKVKALVGPLTIYGALLDADGVNVGDLINCHLREYHLDRVTTKLKNFQITYNKWRNDTDQLKELLDQVEEIDTISSLMSGKDHVRAAIFPILAPWSTLHISIYNLLIINETGKERAALEKRSDEWLIFYTQLLLRYGRPHKIDTVQRMGSKIFWLPFFRETSRIQKHKIMQCHTELIKNWSTLARTNSTRNQIESLRESCVLKSGDDIQLRRVGECWGQSETCKNSVCKPTCSKVKWMLGSVSWLACTQKDKICKFSECYNKQSDKNKNASWDCPDNTFSIFDEDSSNQISMLKPIKLVHDYIDGIYSLRIRDLAVPIPKWAVGMVGISDLEPISCPHKICKQTELRMLRWDNMGEILDDGSFVLIGKKGSHVYEIMKHGSECSRTSWLHIPV